MRPRLHRAAKLRLVLRVVATIALAVGFVAFADLALPQGVDAVTASVAVLSAAAIVVGQALLAALNRPRRSRATMPRSLRERIV